MHNPRLLKKPALSAAVAVLLCGPALTLADEPELAPVTVRGNRSADLPVHTSVEEERKRLYAIPGGTNLIEPQKEARLATLRDALDYQPGVVIQDFFGGTDQPRLNIRGSGIQSNPVNRGVLLLQDGLPLNEADGSFIIGLIEPRNSSLISARRGANATSPGATTLGGELDFQSLTGLDERGRVRLETGSFGRQGWQAAVGGSGEALDGRVSVSGDRFDGYRHHSNSQRDSLQANLGFKGDGSFENRSYLSWTDLKVKIPTVVPKSRIESNPQGVMGDGNTPQDTLLNVYKRDPRRDASQLRLANRSRWGDEALRQEAGVYWQETDDLFNNQTSHTVTDSRSAGAQWQLAGQPDGASGALAYRLALSWQRSSMDRDLYATNPQTGAQMQRFGSFDLNAENRDALIGADWRLAPGLALVGDVKWNSAVRDARNLGTGAELNQRWNFTNPKIGLNWMPTPATRWYTNLSRSHEAPSYWEIVGSTVAPNNPAAATSELIRLKVQRASTLEIGGQGRLGNEADAPGWTASVYRSEVADELISTTDANGIKVGTYNYAGGTRHLGLEAGINGSWRLAGAGALDYRTAWTYSDFRFKGGEYAGKQIAGVPRHLISAQVLYRQGAWRFGPNVRWLPSDTPTDHANTAGAQQDAYAIVGLSLDWRQGPWTAYVQVDNLNDKRYASSFAIRNRATPDQPGYLPGLGRSMSAGMAYQF
jgi:iron complex outermembrane receptor protein